jgi:hypothetical protein
VIAAKSCDTKNKCNASMLHSRRKDRVAFIYMSATALSQSLACR